MKFILALFFPALLLSCSNAPNGGSQGNTAAAAAAADLASEAAPALTAAQAAAFEALTALQQSSGMRGRLYSTFPNIKQPCYPADTSFVITQAQLLAVLKQHVAYCKFLTAAQQLELAETAVLAQDEYLVQHCRGDQSELTYKSDLPINGTWVLPGLQSRTDLVLVFSFD